MIDGVRPFSGENRTAFFDRLYHHDIPTKGTPLRLAMKAVGHYFERDDNRGPWGATPGQVNNAEQLSCRQNYHLLMTDGHWSGRESPM